MRRSLALLSALALGLILPAATFAQGVEPAVSVPPPDKPGVPGNVPPTPAPAPGSPAATAPALKPAAAPAAPAVGATPDETLSVVRVNVTNQAWDFSRPWGKRPPFTRRAVGTVIAGKRVLVTAELVGNATFIEFETAEGGAKVAATVEAVDYEANVALLKPDDEKFLK